MKAPVHHRPAIRVCVDPPGPTVVDASHAVAETLRTNLGGTGLHLRKGAPAAGRSLSARLMTSPTVGTRIAPHLTLGSVLGSGGMATVFEALHERLGALVAVKVSMVCGEQAAEAEARLLREARMCARLGEAYFPRVYDIGCLSDGRPYYVMERVSGITLDRYVAARGTGVVGAVRLVHQLLSALGVLHSHGIVHLDVKPANILIENDADDAPCLRLMDFGIAQLSGREPSDGEHATQVSGTPGYMAPEQACGRPTDGRADLHAAGIVLYELVAGRSPYHAVDLVELMHAVVTVPMPDVRTHSPSCPADVAEWIARATAKDREERFANAPEARRALSRLSVLQPAGDDPAGVILLRDRRPAPLAVPTGSRSVRAPAASTRPKPRRRMAAAATIAAAVAAGGWYVLEMVCPSDAPTTGAESRPETAPMPEPQGRLRPAVVSTPACPAAAHLAPEDHGETDLALATGGRQPVEVEVGRDDPATPRPLAAARDDGEQNRALRRRRRHERGTRALQARERSDRARHDRVVRTRLDALVGIPGNPY